MSDTMSIEDYLASGGKLTSPGNVPPRYRAELMRLMAIFIDSELAGAAGFADAINLGPGVKERMAAARIVLEKTHHAEKVLRIMGEFGANTDRYVGHHPWTERLPRDAAPGDRRPNADMRLPVFNYPLAGWTDAVVMNLLMGQAVDIQIADYAGLSYQPLAEAFREIRPVEQRHTELALEGLKERDHNAATLQASVDYWWPKVEASFGIGDTGRDAQLRKLGLRKSNNAELHDTWAATTSATLRELSLTPPGPKDIS